MSTLHVILAKTRANGRAVVLKYVDFEFCTDPDAVAAAAAHDGYELMYELDGEPDMEKAVALARKNRLASLPGVRRLWDLRPGKSKVVYMGTRCADASCAKCRSGEPCH